VNDDAKIRELARILQLDEEERATVLELSPSALSELTTLKESLVAKAQALLSRHAKERPPEQVGWRDIFDIDDCVELSRVAQGETDEASEARTRLVSLWTLFHRAVGRRKEFADLLEEIKEARDGAPEGDVEAELKKALANSLNHFPDGIQKDWERAHDRLEVLKMNKKQKALLHKQAKEELSKPDPSDLDGRTLAEVEEATCKEIVGKLASRSLDRMRFYRDQTDLPIERDDMEELQRYIDRALERAYRFMDTAEPSVEAINELEEMVAHIPEFLRPPTFIKAQRAWRATQRAFAIEAARKRAEEVSRAGNLALLKAAVTQLLAAAKDHFDLYADTRWGDHYNQDKQKQYESSGEWQVFLGVSYAESLKQLKDLKGVLEDDFKEYKDWDAIQKLQAALGALGTMHTAVNGACKAGTAIKGLMEKAVAAAGGATSSVKSKGEGEWLTEWSAVNNLYIGYSMGVATALLSIATRIRALSNETRMFLRSQELKHRAGTDRLTGKREDDSGAFELALANEMNARVLEIEKQGLGIVVDSIELSANVAKLSGIGAWAGYGISISGKAVEVAGNIIFKNIELAGTKRAMATLERARAGDPEARLEIFEDCAWYAKMYIAHLVQQEDPLATVFILQRGYDEADLQKESVQTDVLRDFLIQSAHQKNELEDESSVLSSFVGEPAAALMKRIGNSDLFKRNPVEYNPRWTADAKHVVLDHSIWHQVHDDAVKNAGLAPTPDQVEKVMIGYTSAVSDLVLGREEQLPTVTAPVAPETGKAPPGSVSREKKRFALKKWERLLREEYSLLAALSTALLRCETCTDEGNGQKRQPHAGFIAYRNAVHDLVEKRKTELGQELQLHARRDVTDIGKWYAKPTAIADVAAYGLSKAVWLQYAEDAKKTVYVAGDIVGVGNAMGVYSALAVLDLPLDTDDRRAAVLEREKAIKAVIAALRTFVAGCDNGEFSEYLRALQERALLEARTVDGELFPDWTFTEPPTVMTSGAWKDEVEAAAEAGANASWSKDDDAKAIFDDLVFANARLTGTTPADTLRIQRERTTKLKKAIARAGAFYRSRRHPHLQKWAKAIGDYEVKILKESIEEETDMGTYTRPSIRPPVKTLGTFLNTQHGKAVKMGSLLSGDGGDLKTAVKNLDKFGAKYALAMKQIDEGELESLATTLADGLKLSGPAIAKAMQLQTTCGVHAEFCALLNDIVEVVSDAAERLRQRKANPLATFEVPDWNDERDFKRDTWHTVKEEQIIGSGFMTRRECEVHLGTNVDSFYRLYAGYVDRRLSLFVEDVGKDWTVSHGRKLKKLIKEHDSVMEQAKKIGVLVDRLTSIANPPELAEWIENFKTTPLNWLEETPPPVSFVKLPAFAEHIQ